MIVSEHPLKRIRLNLARSKEFPDGSARHGYELIAPLDGSGHIDLALWRQNRDRCRVRRFWAGQEKAGRLVHRGGGRDHDQWVIDYDPTQSDDDEAGYRLGLHAFLPGEYVSISDSEGSSHTFKVVSVEPVW
jgi:hypothetical protein